MAINISIRAPELFRLCADQEYIDFMVSELNTNDVLYQLNILELLSQLAVKAHGISYLVQRGVLQKIAVLVEALHHNQLGSLLVPGKVE